MEKYQFSDVYELIEATNKHVIYHCPTKRRTLVLYFPKIKGSWSGDAYYFVGVGRKRFNGKTSIQYARITTITNLKVNGIKCLI